jgi:hypothetical protein
MCRIAHPINTNELIRNILAREPKKLPEPSIETGKRQITYFFARRGENGVQKQTHS